MNQSPPRRDPPQIDPQRCTCCDPCPAGAACRARAIRILDPGEPPIMQARYCWGCLACARACPSGAIRREGSPRDEPPPA